MRLSNNLMYQSSVNKILEGQQGVANAQERVTTGKKYLSTSESPSAYSQAALYTNKIQTNEQYTKNINQLNGRLETEESILQSINTTIQAAQELAIRAGSGAMSNDDLKSIASELSELQKSLVSLMNSQSEDGKYIFSGYQDTTQTYSFNSNTGQYDYQGDQGQHSVTIAQGVNVKSSDNGFSAFENVNARLNVVDNEGTITGSITAQSTVYVKNQADFDKFHKANFDLDPTATAADNSFQVELVAGVNPGDPDTYVINDGYGNPVTPAVTGEFIGEPIEYAGMEFKLEGKAPGTFEFELEAPHKENVLNTMQNLITSLNSSLAGDELNDALADGLDQLQSASEQVVFTQASLGARMNLVESVTDSNSAIDINNKSSKSNLVEVDMAEAISDLTRHETALQASQATFGRLANLTLFDYL
ncbi:flagellar hook-associated protein FlgL [Pseudoalteromonas sp. ACER1]|uniref:flagellar hook-associated protein FlgL n=1 Tax=unclassified Pseudoalteromonas TaxID=194690 RepID=UPI001F22812F|nr:MULTISPECIES: flagellar hook-associated protein FlgL [unclassified Pseudoalteromonas]MCF2847165.1 flagellar hook-associated protein FlgL [Pseudoalteromonas sp. PAST1]MCO7210889.1 flagellar hook-associated protein FlgL [Pseudoalteromonas sp. ACER1]